MFQQSWPDACARYREILAADSTNFTAWYGLAECNAGDPVVIRDPRDSARYVFRGSWHAAARAYKHALLLAPSFNLAFGTRARERLAHLLLAEEFWWREGRFNTVPCFAFPEVEADTVAFHPLSGAVMAQGSRDRKSTRLNSSHTVISYAVFCLKKKTAYTMPDFWWKLTAAVCAAD